ncbi:ATP-binding cassette domain-containing protein [Pseudoalteromonas sp. Ld20]|uniref:ATP-binding cassette domain-containing protein n=1 Tax=Pseudoalteromonas sp. Ld20 TaxID=649165 RepID=UPI00386E851A
MHTLHVHNLGFQYPDGHNQFKQLNFSVTEKLTAIIGANGSGKSLLANILANKIQPTAGSVEFSANVLLISQQQVNEQPKSAASQTIAQLLAIDTKLAALTRIAQGSSCEADFNAVNDDWLCEQRYQQELLTLGIDAPLKHKLTELSGGQQRRLLLYCALQAAPDLLILDEPSNHLDIPAKRWLIAQLHTFKGLVIIVSHDRQLLNECDAIIELNSQGAHYMTGNYQHFSEQKALQQTALIKQINHLEKDQKKHQQQTQLNHEKAQQRAAQGNKIRNNASQPKMMLDFKKNNAQASKGNSERLATAKHQAIIDKRQALKEQLPTSSTMKLQFNLQTTHKRLLFVEQLVLPFKSASPITFSVFNNDKLHIKGPNGCGKSTLLHLISNSANPPSRSFSGAVQLNSKILYIDQHCAFLTSSQNLVNALEVYCSNLDMQHMRHLLANIGFKGDDIYRPISQLSGGEKMQLAMLIAAHNAQAYLLLLDEPDNHLDLDNKQLLANCLSEFKGSFMLVSHDEEFILQCNVTAEIDLSLD